MNIFVRMLCVLFCLAGVCRASAEDEWVTANGEEQYGTYCFVVMPDGRLLTFHAFHVLQAKDGYTGWDIVGSHERMSMEKVGVTPRGELITGVRTIGSEGVWKSEDGGKTWQQKGERMHSPSSVSDIHIDEQGYIYTCGGGLWRSRDNGESWSYKASSIGGSTAMGVRRDGVMILCGGNGIYRLENWTANFELMKNWGFSIYGEDVEIHNSGVVIVGSNSGGGLAWRSDTAGKNFEVIAPIKSVAAITIDSVGRIYAFAFSQAEEKHYVFRSLDTGKTWQVYNSGRTGAGANTVYGMITTPDGYVFTGGSTMHRTKNRMHQHPVFWGKRRFCTAVEYVVVDSSVVSVELVPEQSSNVQFQRLSPLGAGKVRIRLPLVDYAQTGVYTLRAVNAAGVETLHRDTLRQIVPEPEFHRSGDTLWANGGYVYQWYKNGEKIEGERKEYIVLQSEGVYRVSVENSNGCIGWSGEYAHNGTGVEAARGGMATALFAPIPNPSSGEVELSYTLSNAGVVRITIVDVLGRAKARLGSTVADGNQPAGLHRIRFNGANLPAGVYWIRLESAGSIYTQPLVMVE